jgi:choice-of-anchor B domain-containing protein
VTRRIALAAAALLGVLCGILAGPASALPVIRNFALQAWKNDFPPPPDGQNYSACWSYIHSDGREYAVIGVNGLTSSTGGTAIYNVTDPAAPYLVGFIPGPQSIWHEYKSYRDWIYAVTEGAGTGCGLQIIRMTDPEAPVLAATYTTNFRTSHTVAVDTTRGILICNGATNDTPAAAGMRILALNNPEIGASPESPAELTWWPGGAIPISYIDYVHDSVPVGNRLYASCIYSGILRVLDFTNPAAPTEIASWHYPGAFTHNSWPDATGNWLYVTDEINGEPLKIFDISNLASPVLANAITSNPQAIIHNAHVRGSELYLSNYTEGIRALDLSDPCHPAEFASADSYAGPSGGYSGVWEVCPFFPSGTVIASDRNSGLYVYRVVRDYGIVRVRVVDAATALPVSGVKVYLTTQGDSLVTPTDGIVQFAPSPGTHTVLAHPFGWSAASATRTVSVGSRDTVTLALTARPVGMFAGTVRSSVTGNPLDGSEVSLAYTPVHQHTGPDGQYALSVPDDIYRLEVRCAGYVPRTGDRHIGPLFPGQDFSLVPAAFWDDLQTDLGWTVGASGDDATSGLWTRVGPLGTGTRPPSTAPQEAATGAVRPEARRAASPFHAQHQEPAAATPNLAPFMDHTPGAGTMCFVTGQGTDSLQLDQADVDGGQTSLTTPALDASGMTDPVIGYWRWFASFFPTSTSAGNNGPEPADYLAVLLSNDDGASWTPVDTTRGLENHWEEQAIHVAGFLAPTAQVKVRFVARDGSPASYVESAIDDLTLYDAAGAATVPPPAGGGRLAFRAPWPDPASGAVRLVLDLPVAAVVGVDVLDAQGRRVRTLHRGRAGAGPLTLSWDGRDAVGRETPPGLYFARATAGAARALTRFVRVR